MKACIDIGGTKKLRFGNCLVFHHNAHKGRMSNCFAKKTNIPFMFLHPTKYYASYILSGLSV